MSENSSESPATRLAALRAEIVKRGLDGFIVPMEDEYQNEYVPPSARRLAFLTGFTGSAGMAIVLKDRAAFFTDSRYTLQAERQIPAGLYEPYDTAQKRPRDWLAQSLRAGQKIGFTAALHSARQIELWEKAIEKTGGTLTPSSDSPLDRLWTNRPPAEVAPIVPYDLLYAGQSAKDKRERLAAELKAKNVQAAVLTDSASIAWLLNVRGGDVPGTPLPLSFAILHADATVEWFVNPHKSTPALEGHLSSAVLRDDESAFPVALKRLGEAGCVVRVDPTESSYEVLKTLKLSGAKLDVGADPCALPKACKNATELDGIRAAHRRDGAALVRFLAWLDEAVSKKTVTELEAEERLTAFRAQGDLYKGPSFDTIAASGPHGAIVHYRADETTNRALQMGELFLLDSGAQYLDGTTDVTRTVALGTPSSEMRERFTRTLKGHIALASVAFPPGTSGAELDVLARQFLWAAGLDYGHGTGHGVGCYLSVHEGPQSISRRSDTALVPGMVLSNEPGYYKAGAYGLRLENMQAVVERNNLPGAENPMLAFEVLTLAPFDRRAIMRDMLTPSEIDWLDTYHARVRRTLRPQLDTATAAWLEAATAAL